MIPVVVCSTPHEHGLREALTALMAAIEHAEASDEALRYELLIVLTDFHTTVADVARSFERTELLMTHGNLIAAQRTAVQARPDADFLIFVDADIWVNPGSVLAITRAMQADPGLRVAAARKRPLDPSRWTPISRAIYAYAASAGFGRQGRFFNGRMFAIRKWNVPTAEELIAQRGPLAQDPFLRLETGIWGDDVFISLRVVYEDGPEAMVTLPNATAWFRPPETFDGLYRMYRRLRMHTDRVRALYPEYIVAHPAGQRRHSDPGPSYDRRVLQRPDVGLWCAVPRRAGLVPPHGWQGRSLAAGVGEQSADRSVRGARRSTRDVVSSAPSLPTAGGSAVDQRFLDHLAAETAALRDAGLFKDERVIVTPQSAAIEVKGGQRVINFCANNYLGSGQSTLSVDRPTARAALSMSTATEWPRCASYAARSTVHKELEGGHLPRSSGTEDTILYSSCFDANGGLFETHARCPEDAVISRLAESRLDHRRGTALQGASAFGTPTTTWMTLPAKLEGGCRLPLQADRHRWGLLHGRDPGQPEGHL